MRQREKLIIVWHVSVMVPVNETICLIDLALTLELICAPTHAAFTFTGLYSNVKYTSAPSLVEINVKKYVVLISYV